MNLGMSTAESLEWSTAVDKVITVYRASQQIVQVDTSNWSSKSTKCKSFEWSFFYL